ncbi:MAG: Rpn family recombination-promoting nuclease/putative transposase [Bacilli bacterium]
MQEFKKLSNDGMMKLVLSHKDILKLFLERILKRKINKFDIRNGQDNKPINEEKIIELMKQELTKDNINIKTKIVDLLVKIDNEIINIEYNNTYDEYTKMRNFAYMSNIYSNIVKKGEKYTKQIKCTQINFCSNISENYNKEINYVKGEYYNHKFINNISFYEFNIAKYKKLLYTDNNKLIKRYSHLIIFDCNKEELELLERYDPEMKKTIDLIKKYNDDSTIYKFMSTEEDQEKLTKSRIIDAKELGIKQGLEQGLEQGIELTKNETAISLLKERIPLDIISRTTGYSKDYLKSIQI